MAQPVDLSPLSSRVTFAALNHSGVEEFAALSGRGAKGKLQGETALAGNLLLMQEDATVSVCHIFTDAEDTRRFCLDADIIISAAGCLNLMLGQNPVWIVTGQREALV